MVRLFHCNKCCCIQYILAIYFIKTASRVPHVECFEGDWFSNSKVQSLIADYLIIANVAKTVTQPTQLQSMF